MDKRIACIVVTYNRKELLFNCIQHICNQSYRPETIYVIDNASTDGTLEMADKMKKIAKFEKVSFDEFCSDFSFGKKEIGS